MKTSILSFFLRKLKNIRLIIHGNNCDLKTLFNLSDESTIDMNNCSFKNSNVYVRGKSELLIGDNCEIINSEIFIDKGSSFSLGNNCKIINSSIKVNRSSTLNFQDYSLVISEKPYYESSIKLIDGSANLGTNSTIKGTIIVNDGNLQIGSNVFLNHGSEIRCEEKISIGDYVFISYFVDIFDTNTHSLDWQYRKQEVIDGFPNTTKRTYKPLTKRIEIGDFVWIGKNASILKGCEIGPRSIIGTKAVVTKSYQEDSLIAGNPSHLVRKLK